MEDLAVIIYYYSNYLQWPENKLLLYMDGSMARM